MLRRILNLNMPTTDEDRTGKIRYGLAAWLVGLPLPIIILALLWRGCDF